MGVYIIAEMSCNHMGSFDKAIEIIDAAANAGADAVKISLDSPDGGLTINHKSGNFMIKDGPWKGEYLHDLYARTHTPWTWAARLKAHADSLGIELFATVSCKYGVEFCEALDMPRYKVSSYEACDIPLIREIKKTGKPVIVSCGMDWHDAWDELQGYPASFLYCVSKYPATTEDFDLNVMREFDGISDHSAWSNDVAVAAVAQGAQIVERHLMLYQPFDGISPDHAFSLDVGDFGTMVSSIRRVQRMMRPKQFKRPDRQLCKSLYCVEDIKKGERFTDSNVRAIRPGNGLHPREYYRIIGLVSKCDIKRGMPIKEAMI